MKRSDFAILSLALFFLTVAGPSTSSACTTGVSGLGATPTSPAPNASVEAEIRALDESQAKAWVARDQAALERFWSPDFVIQAPSNQILTRDGAFREMRTPRLELLSLERTVERVTPFGDIAISMGVDHYEADEVRDGPGGADLAPYLGVGLRV